MVLDEKEVEVGEVMIIEDDIQNTTIGDDDRDDDVQNTIIQDDDVQTVNWHMINETYIYYPNKLSLVIEKLLKNIDNGIIPHTSSSSSSSSSSFYVSPSQRTSFRYVNISQFFFII